MKMKLIPRLLIIPALFLAIPSPSGVAGARDETAPDFFSSKFELPLGFDEITKEWKALGYSQCQFEAKGKGWSKGEHTHPFHILLAGKTGQMEFIIEGRRYVLEPGDELYYRKNAVMAARNLHDEPSEWFTCRKSL